MKKEKKSESMLTFLKYVFISFGVATLIPLIFILMNGGSSFIFIRLILLIILFAGLAVFQILIGINLKNRKKWAWWAGLIFGIINIFLFVFLIIPGLAIIPLMVVILLGQKDIRKLFV
jgi:hypothetical protein